MTGLGIAAALPATSRAQQATPTIGFLSTRSPDEATLHTNAFRSGLEETGYVEGNSVAIEYRWAKGDYGKLPSLAAELAEPSDCAVGRSGRSRRTGRQGGGAEGSSRVSRRRRPGALGSGHEYESAGSGHRRQLLHRRSQRQAAGAALRHGAVGACHRLAGNPRFGAEVAAQQRQAVTAAAKELGRELVVQEAATEAEIESSFVAFVKAGIAGLIVQNDPFFDSGEALWWRSHPAIVCPAFSISGSIRLMAG